MSIKKNDNVVIITGKDKGKRGKVLRIIPRENKIMVEGINMVKKRQRPKKSGQKGQVLEKAMPVDISNAKIICSACDEGVRTGNKLVGEKKIRVCRKCGAEV